MDQDPWVAILLASLALGASIGAGVIAARTAKKASDFIARSGRFAEWQMYKRKTYGGLLAAIRAAQIDPTPQQLAETAAAFDAAQLAAGPRLERVLSDARAQFAIGSRSQTLDSSLQQFIEEMRLDITGAQGGPDKPRRASRISHNEEDEYYGEE